MPKLTPKETKQFKSESFEDCFCYGELFLDGLFHLTSEQKTKVNEWLDINDRRTTNKIDPSSLSSTGLQKLYSHANNKEFGCDLFMDERTHFYWFNGEDLYSLPNSQILDLNEQQLAIIKYEIKVFRYAVIHHFTQGDPHA